MKNMHEQYQQVAVPQLQKQFGYQTPFAAPRILKVVINVGTGKVRDKKDAIEMIERHLAFIAAQKPSLRSAKKAVASFKSRKGMTVGYAATLRGARMFDFLYRLVHFAIPRTRDFRGIPLRSIDHGGNLTVGIREHIVFPEMIGEDIRAIFGLEATIVTNAKTREEAIALFRLLGFPLQK